jgi:hypothetical protein
LFHRLLFFYGGCVIILYTKNSMKQTAAYPAGGAAFCRERGCMGKINREDMLELTRRMTLRRNCFDRIAGAYLDEEGFVDGTFNKHFHRLSQKDQQINLDIAKAIPFSDTNVQLKEYVFGGADQRPGSIWQLLMALKECGLKNDAMLDVFYEEFGKVYRADGSYAVYFFHGSYDVPLKASDKESLWESEEVYQFLICAVCPVSGDYEPGKPECGFLFPAFKDRSSDTERVNIFQAAGNFGEAGGVEEILFSRQ